MNCCAISTAKRNPAQAAEMSRQAAFFAPIFVWMKQAVAGKTMSGVAVATRMRSISSPLIPACSIAFKRGLRAHVAGVFILGGDAAFLDSGAGGDPLVVVSTIFERSSFVRTFFRHVTAGANDRDGALRFSGARARAGRVVSL